MQFVMLLIKENENKIIDFFFNNLKNWILIDNCKERNKNYLG